ncbi:ABC transporter substrate-binding protein [Lysinibacillus piscis]|uniref:Lipoprotein n=1 Tax=Lysinibacillus piscis TaxID=2518931 RepID=A0ABQ5NJ89_9BACI|nr:ABC transporter substrate-binding protein [Lysinibacillus sp. KH24]GLC88441.1 lipoprotein [Lysinibacillus sp. KH24]
MKKWLLTLAMMTSIILAACSNDTKTTEDTASTPEAPAENTAVTINNQDFVIDYTEAPKKAISLNQHVTEIMLALGLEDSMVGTAYLDDEIYPPLQTAYEKVPVIAEQYPTKEQVINAEADFLYGGWSSAFNEKNIATREELKELGINTYLQNASTMINPKLQDIYGDIANIAKIFRVEERGEKLITQMKTDVEAITSQMGEVSTPLKVLVFDSGDKEVFTAAQNFMNELVTVSGGQNIFGDVDKTWTTVSKEAVVERAPEVIVIIDYGDTTAEQKIEFIKNDPALSTVPAVANNHFVILPLSAAAEGVRAADAIGILAKGFYPEKFN